MPQTIDITSAETAISRHAFDADPQETLTLVSAEVTSIDGAAPASGAEAPAWFRAEATDVSTSTVARLRLTVYIRAYDAEAAGVGTFSYTAAVTDGANPAVQRTWTVTLVPYDGTVAASTGLAVTVEPEALRVAWTSSVDADVAEERLYRSNTSPVDRLAGNLVTTITAPAAGASQEVADSGLTAGTLYHYVVETEDTSGNVAAGAEASAVPDALDTTVAAPTGLAATAGTEEVSLTWTSSADTDLFEERLYRSTTSPVDPVGNPGGAALVHTVTAPAASAAQSFTDTGLAGGTTYYYAVQAEDTAGNTTLSAEDSAMPLNPPNEPEPGATAPTDLLYIEHESPDGLYAYNLDAGTTTSVLTTTDARELAFDPADLESTTSPWLFVYSSGAVRGYSGPLTSLAEEWSWAINAGEGVAFHKGRLFTGDGNTGQAYELDPALGTATLIGDVGTVAAGMEADVDAGYLFVAEDSGGLTRLTIADGTALQIATGTIRTCALHRSVQTVYFVDDAGDLRSVGYDGTGDTVIASSLQSYTYALDIEFANGQPAKAYIGQGYTSADVRVYDFGAGTTTTLITSSDVRGLRLYPGVGESAYDGVVLLDAEPLVHLAEETEANGSPSLEGDPTLIHLDEEAASTNTTPSLEGGSLLIHLAEERA